MNLKNYRSKRRMESSKAIVGEEAKEERSVTRWAEQEWSRRGGRESFRADFGRGEVFWLAGGRTIASRTIFSLVASIMHAPCGGCRRASAGRRVLRGPPFFPSRNSEWRKGRGERRASHEAHAVSPFPIYHYVYRSISSLCLPLSLSLSLCDWDWWKRKRSDPLAFKRDVSRFPFRSSSRKEKIGRGGYWWILFFWRFLERIWRGRRNFRIIASLRYNSFCFILFQLFLSKWRVWNENYKGRKVEEKKDIFSRIDWLIV